MRTEFYSQNSHTVLADGFALEDLFEGDDVIAFEPQGDAVTATRGLDRNRLSFGGRRTAILTVRLKPTSPSIERLSELVRAQNEGNPRLIPVQVTTGVNDVLSLDNCGIVDNGFTTGGPSMQAREYQFIAESYELNE